MTRIVIHAFAKVVLWAGKVEVVHLAIKRNAINTYVGAVV